MRFIGTSSVALAAGGVAAIVALSSVDARPAGSETVASAPPATASFADRGSGAELSSCASRGLRLSALEYNCFEPSFTPCLCDNLPFWRATIYMVNKTCSSDDVDAAEAFRRRSCPSENGPPRELPSPALIFIGMGVGLVVLLAGVAAAERWIGCPQPPPKRAAQGEYVLLSSSEHDGDGHDIDDSALDEHPLPRTPAGQSCVALPVDAMRMPVRACSLAVSASGRADGTDAPSYYADRLPAGEADPAVSSDKAFASSSRSGVAQGVSDAVDVGEFEAGECGPEEPPPPYDTT
ncbi:hypothetical protein OH77DRAFT_1428918 [Trametes cingulata]|nr:hypothetical protein OH77DRAFT_1428918 [Trametes cingulata]